MATKLWIKTYKGRPAILVGKEAEQVRFRVDDRERLVSAAAWEALPLWTGLSPFLDDGKHGSS